MADEVLSTGGIVRKAHELKNKKFLIGTESGILYRLKKENPDKEFYTAGTPKVCQNMKRTTLNDVYLALNKKLYSVEIPSNIMRGAKKALEEMLKYA